MISLTARRFTTPAFTSRLLMKSYSSAAAKEFQPDAAAAAESTTNQLFNGVKIGTHQTFGALASVAMYIKAGSRYEDFSNRGASHLLKNLAFQSTDNQYSVGILRGADHHGIRLSASSTREHIIVRADGNTGNIEQVVDVMLGEITSPKFQHHEVEDSKNFCLEQSHSYLSDPQVFMTEQIHKTAFLSGLGNGVFASPNQLANLNADSVKAYFDKHVNTGSVSFVASGVYSHELRDALVENDLFENISSGSAPETSSQYFGGKTAMDAFDQKSRIMYGVKASGLYDQKSFADAVFAHLIGGKAHVKYGSGVSRLSKAASGVGMAASPFHFAYSDHGLVGFYLETPNGQLDAAYKIAMSEINEIANTLTNEEVARAQNSLKMHLAEKQGSVLSMVDEMAHKVENSSYLLPNEVNDAISKVNIGDLKLVAQRFFQENVTIVVASDDFKGC